MRVWVYAQLDPSLPRNSKWGWVQKASGDAACDCVDDACLQSVKSAVTPIDLVRQRDLLREATSASPEQRSFWSEGRSVPPDTKVGVVVRGRQALIATQGGGACPSVVDLDTHEVLFSPSAGVADAVWVKPPDSWSYTKTAAVDSKAAMPLSYVTSLAGDGCEAGGCQWRIFDPGSGRNEVYQTLTSEPTNIIWDKFFDKVTYRAGDRLYEADWRAGAVPRPIAAFPAEFDMKKLWDTWWDDNAGTWQAIEMSHGDKDSNYFASARLWQLDGDRWKIAEQMALDCYSDEPCAEIPRKAMHVEASLTLASLAGRHSLASAGPTLYVDDNGLVRYPSLTVPGRFLEVRWEGMDESSMVGPLSLVIGETGEKIIFSDYANFSERAGFLLLGTAGPLVDLRSGKNLLPGDGAIHSAVWVQPLSR